MAKKKNNDFDLMNLPVEAQDPEIKAEDFVLCKTTEKIHEQKLQTKPTTFFKDSMRRFAKNKSSVVAGVILGILLLAAIVVPIADTNDVSSAHTQETFLEPKLFNAGTGFWDGTKYYSEIAVDTSKGSDPDKDWWPNESEFTKSAISNKTFTNEQRTDKISAYGKDGYLHIGYYSNFDDEIGGPKEYSSLTSTMMSENFDTSVDTYLTVFDVYDVEKLRKVDGEEYAKVPENYVLGKAALFFNYVEGEIDKTIQLTEYKTVHNIGSDISSIAEDKINISKIIKDATGLTILKDPSFSINVLNEHNNENTCALVKKLAFETESTNEDFVSQLNDASFSDASECYRQEKTIKIKNSKGIEEETINHKYWSSSEVYKIYSSKVIYCSFTYDTYEAHYGNYVNKDFPLKNLEAYAKNGWMKWNVRKTIKDGKYVIDESKYQCEIIDYDKCPVVENIPISNVMVDSSGNIHVIATVTKYKELGYSSMPIFLFGTNKEGKDMFKYVFEGLRTSLILSIITTFICCIFGLAYGAISGYYGGKVDLVMERFTDILSGMPWIVVMTLVILNLGQGFVSFAIALCLTGWIATAATTRTQFYRFRGREYVLASRTLGASDARLIRKHILPNALGTIITAEVLAIPSVIFSEASISYLGLGLQGLSSLGVILSDNQKYIFSYPFLLIFPSVIIALLMISFNLFGNGLRDAVNPSLKGEEE